MILTKTHKADSGGFGASPRPIRLECPVYQDPPLTPGGRRPRDEVGGMGEKPPAGDGEVGVDQRTRGPGAGGASKLTSIGLPPSGLAASTMPFDSIPISVAGFRLATIAT